MPITPHLALSFDVGGTFTDFTLVDLATGLIVAEHKVPTDPGDPAASSLAGWRDLIASGTLNPDELALVVHATTLVTNAVIERKGAPTAFLTTAGFRDLLSFGREQMYDIYDLFAPPPTPLVPREFRVEADERVTRDGTVLRPLDPAQIISTLRPLVDNGLEAVAIGFLHSYLSPNHEECAAAAIADAFPGVDVSLSSRVAPRIGEYERFTTTVADAYVKGKVRRAIGGLTEALRNEGLPANREVQIMLSAGGIAASSEAIERPIRLLESGPAAGALVAAYHGALAGRDRVLALDMGGTTAKACLIDGGKPGLAPTLEAARVGRFKPGSGLPIAIPVIDLIEIGAGGGSIARADELGLLKVGPDSAAATPGPACYGHGGVEPTVTDANLLLGYLAGDSFLGGRMRLDRTAAEDALARLGGQLGLSPLETAWGVHRVANEHMAAAARLHAIEKNRDPRRYSLLAFGGAGPAHAIAVAALLDIEEVIFPPGAGVAAALGCLVAPPAIDLARTYAGRLDCLDWSRIEEIYTEMEREAVASLAAAGVTEDDVRIQRSVDLRLEGQYHELTVPLHEAGRREGEKARETDRFAPHDLAAAFAKRYAERYGRMLTGLPIEATTWRVEARGPEGRVRLAPLPVGDANPASAQKGTRPVFFAAPEPGFVETPVYDRARLAAGTRLLGPAIVEEPAATAVLHPGDRAEVNPYGALIVHRGAAQ
ncbi:MAG: N-methylhydantoinase [Thermomicrobiales bacterium]|nr:N-methylhydantoinase [Thermomicrobiales bacterium]